MYNQNKSWLKIVSVFTIFVFSVFAQTKTTAPSDPKTCPIILEGYDITSYHNAGVPEKGSTKYQVVYREKRYLFANDKNRLAFSKNPSKYASPLGEHCAFSALKKSSTKEVANPKLFSFSNKKIYFFKNKEAQKQWELQELNNQSKIKKFLSNETKQFKVYENQNSKGVLLLRF